MVHRLGVKPPMDFTTGNEWRALRSSSTHLWNVSWISQYTTDRVRVEQKRRSATASWCRQAGKVRQEHSKQHKREGFGWLIIAEAKCYGLKSLVYSLDKLKEIINYLYSAVIIIIITIRAWVFGMVLCKLKLQKNTTNTLRNKQTSGGEVPGPASGRICIGEKWQN